MAKQKNGMWAGAGIGVLFGAGGGAIIAAALEDEECSGFEFCSKEIAAAIGAVVGSLVGFMVGMAAGSLVSWQSWETVPVNLVRVSVTPNVGLQVSANIFF